MQSVWNDNSLGGSCWELPLWGAGSTPSISEQGWNSQDRHLNALTLHSPSHCCRKNCRSFDGFCSLQVKDQCSMDTRGRETRFSFTPINFRRVVSASELFGSFKDLQQCSTTPELHKEWRTQKIDSFLDFFFHVIKTHLHLFPSVLSACAICPFPCYQHSPQLPWCAQPQVCISCSVLQHLCARLWENHLTVHIKLAHFTCKNTNKDHCSKWGEKLSLASEVCDLNWVLSANCSYGSPFHLHKFSLFFSPHTQ